MGRQRNSRNPKPSEPLARGRRARGSRRVGASARQDIAHNSAMTTTGPEPESKHAAPESAATAAAAIQDVLTAAPAAPTAGQSASPDPASQAGPVTLAPAPSNVAFSFARPITPPVNAGAANAAVPADLHLPPIPPLFDPYRVASENVGVAAAAAAAPETQGSPRQPALSQSGQSHPQHAAAGFGADRPASTGQVSHLHAGAGPEDSAAKMQPGQFDTEDEVVLDDLLFRPEHDDPRNPVFRHPREPPRPKRS